MFGPFELDFFNAGWFDFKLDFKIFWDLGFKSSLFEDIISSFFFWSFGLWAVFWSEISWLFCLFLSAGLSLVELNVREDVETVDLVDKMLSGRSEDSEPPFRVRILCVIGLCLILGARACGGGGFTLGFVGTFWGASDPDKSWRDRWWYCGKAWCKSGWWWSSSTWLPKMYWDLGLNQRTIF